MRRSAVVLTVLALSTGAALAQAPFLLVPEEKGAVACWKRTYSEAHLAQHPDQTVTEMTFGRPISRPMTRPAAKRG